MPRARRHQPIAIYFPAGIPDRLAHIARAEALDEQWLAFFLWQLQFRLVRQIRDAKRDLEEIDLIATLNAATLYEIHETYSSYVSALVRHDVIQMRINYEPHTHSRFYSYNPAELVLGKQDRYDLTKKTVINSFLRRHTAVKHPEVQQRRSYLSQFDLDYQAALTWAQEQATTKPYDLWLQDVQFNLDLIRDQRLRLSKDRYGREHSNFTNIPKHIRQHFITCQNQQLIELDLPCCQPHMLFLLVQPIPALTRETNRLADVLKSDLYLHFADRYQHFFNQLPTREEMKEETYRFLFGRTRFDLPIFQLWQHCFPELTKHLSVQKKLKGYNSVAADLQRQESNLIFSTCRTLTEKELTPYFTVHDSVTCLPSCADQTEQLLLKGLEDRGINWINALNR